MLGVECIGCMSISEIDIATPSGSSQYPAFIPSLNSLLGGASSGNIIPLIIWHLRQQGNS